MAAGPSGRAFGTANLTTKQTQISARRIGALIWIMLPSLKPGRRARQKTFANLNVPEFALPPLGNKTLHNPSMAGSNFVGFKSRINSENTKIHKSIQHVESTIEGDPRGQRKGSKFCVQIWILPLGAPVAPLSDPKGLLGGSGPPPWATQWCAKVLPKRNSRSRGAVVTWGGPP